MTGAVQAVEGVPVPPLLEPEPLDDPPPEVLPPDDPLPEEPLPDDPSDEPLPDPPDEPLPEPEPLAVTVTETVRLKPPSAEVAVMVAVPAETPEACAP